jgi:hypothetical protein
VLEQRLQQVEGNVGQLNTDIATVQGGQIELEARVQELDNKFGGTLDEIVATQHELQAGQQQLIRLLLPSACRPLRAAPAGRRAPAELEEGEIPRVEQKECASAI